MCYHGVLGRLRRLLRDAMVYLKCILVGCHSVLCGCWGGFLGVRRAAMEPSARKDIKKTSPIEFEKYSVVQC